VNNEVAIVDMNALFKANGIRIAQSGERHYRSNWIHTACPFCSGHSGNHLGFSLQANIFTCHRCGRHGKFKTIAALLNMSLKDAVNLAKNFSGNMIALPQRVERVHIAEDDFKLPGTETASSLCREYLQGRGFDADRLFRKWELRYTGNTGRYKFRILCPITYLAKAVSFTARDITGRQQERYLSAFPDDEVRSAKRCLYGEKFARRFKKVIVVEGPADAWRIGHGAVATLGTKWKPIQAKLITEWDASFILYDPGEPDAQDRAERLCHEVSLYRGHKSRVLDIRGTDGRDPGEFTKDEVREIRKFLG